MVPNVAGSNPVDRPFVLMDNWTAVLLGMVQGITEFFPVSSSGHLMILESVLGIKESLFFNVVCHLGTLGSIVTVFHKDIVSIERAKCWRICAATLPLVPCVVLLKEIRYLFTKPEFLPYFFAVTALLLFLSDRARKISAPNLKNALLVGLGQSAALFPGISRSGTTIACGRLLGWSKEEAIQFSFLMAIPAILGAVVLETYQTVREGGTILLVPALIGLVVSYLFGVGALLLLKRIVVQASFKYFAWYCLAISALSYFLFML